MKTVAPLEVVRVDAWQCSICGKIHAEKDAALECFRLGIPKPLPDGCIMREPMRINYADYPVYFITTNITCPGSNNHILHQRCVEVTTFSPPRDGNYEYGWIQIESASHTLNEEWAVVPGSQEFNQALTCATLFFKSVQIWDGTQFVAVGELR